MIEKKPYKNPRITLKNLAYLTDSSEAKLTELFKSRGHNFHSFINQYRVKEAENLLLRIDFKKYTIDAIGESAGFNSRASFYEIFKKNTGKTPKQFQEESLTTK